MQGELFFLQRVDDRNLWEQVDEYTWTHWKNAVLRDSPRYTGNRVHRSPEGLFDVQLGSVDAGEIAVMNRVMKFNVETGFKPYGFCREPEFVKLVFPQGRVIMHEMGGDNFKKVS